MSSMEMSMKAILWIVKDMAMERMFLASPSEEWFIKENGMRNYENDKKFLGLMI